MSRQKKSPEVAYSGSSADKVKSFVAVARGLGMDRPTLWRHFKNTKYSQGRPDKDSSGLYSVSEFRNWLATHGLGAKTQVLSPKHEADVLWKQSQIERNRIKIEKERGILIERRLVEQFFKQKTSELFMDLERVFCFDLPPRVVGKDQSGIARANKAAIRNLKERFGRWEEADGQ